MGIETAQVLSAQEQAILDGKKVLHGTATDRVLRMFDAIRYLTVPPASPWNGRSTSRSLSRSPKVSRWSCAGPKP